MASAANSIPAKGHQPMQQALATTSKGTDQSIEECVRELGEAVIANASRWQALTHKDSEQVKPLVGSIKNGMTFIEFDVHLKDGNLFIGHDEKDLQLDKTLELIYLNPLARYVEENGYLFKDGTPLKLMVDIKSDSEETYKVLHHILGKYAHILMHYKDGTLIKGPVQIIVSGNRAIEAISSTEPRYVFIDGRVVNFDQPMPHELMPIISGSWRKVLDKPKHYKVDNAADAQYTRRTLLPFVDKAKRCDIKFRLWGAPDDEVTWALLLSLDSDTVVLNTDTPEKLSSFLNEMAKNGK